jgi:hypothetical protein
MAFRAAVAPKRPISPPEQTPAASESDEEVISPSPIPSQVDPTDVFRLTKADIASHQAYLRRQRAELSGKTGDDAFARNSSAGREKRRQAALEKYPSLRVRLVLPPPTVAATAAAGERPPVPLPEREFSSTAPLSAVYDWACEVVAATPASGLCAADVVLATSPPLARLPHSETSLFDLGFRRSARFLVLGAEKSAAKPK